MAVNFFKNIDQSNIRKKSVKGGAFTFGSQGLLLLISILSNVILARILLPEAFGLIAMVMAVTALAKQFNNLGLSMATIQKKQISSQEVSNLFWVNSSLGFIVSVVVFLSAPLIALLYKTPELTSLTQFLSISFLIRSMGIQHQALLRRQMMFKQIAIIDIASTLLGVVVAIVFAYLGMKYWALAFMNVASAFFWLILVFFSCRWIPQLPKELKKSIGLIKFGFNISGFNIVNYFSRNTDKFLIGKFLGASQLGFYSKAYQLLLLPISQIRGPMLSVAYPALSSLQDDPKRYKNYLSQYLSILAFVSMPLSVFLWLFSREIILLILGPNWIETVEIFKIMAFVSFIQPVGTVWGLVLITLGKSKSYFYWGIVFSLVMVLSYMAGISWGVKGVTVAYAIANYLILIPSLFYGFKGSSFTIKDFFASISNAIVASVSTGIIVYFLVVFLELRLSNWVVTTISAIAFPLIYLLAFYLLPNGKSKIVNIFTHLKEIVH